MKSQDLILKGLESTIQKYDLGVLAEESDHDKSRLKCSFFWAIDPIDGTIFFSQGKPGFAIAISLISKSGFPYIGVVYDPVKELFHAIKGEGSKINDKKLSINTNNRHPPTLFADFSLRNKANFKKLSQNYEIIFSGGAVLNALNAIRSPNSFYIKEPQNNPGGCSTWDIAAAALIVKEAGGYYLDFQKKENYA